MTGHPSRIDPGGGAIARIDGPCVTICAMGEQVVGRLPARPRHPGLDMVRSLGLVAVVLVLWLVVSHPRTPAREPVPWQAVAASAAASARFEVIAPSTAFTWTATVAWVEGKPDGTFEWRAGFLDHEGAFASLAQRGAFPDQAHQAAADWLRQVTRNGKGDQAVTVADRTWVRMTGDTAPDERRSLVLRDAGTLTVLTGTASWDSLAELAATLHPVSPTTGVHGAQQPEPGVGTPVSVAEAGKAPSESQ